MPISPIVLQRRHAELGRIRLGNQTPTSNGRTRPNKLSAFRFTSPSERYVRDLATLYGGDAQPWDNNGVASWEVFTTANSIPVIAVKGGLSQWMETWSGGGCVHRCDGERNTLTDAVCDPNDPQHQDAKPTTRLSVMLPELEAIGVWRMESHGWNAAAEIPAVAELAQYVGDLVPANLHLVERRSVKDGKTSRFVVPVLDLQIGTARLKQIVAEKSGGELTAGPAGQPAVNGQERAAIAAGPTPVGDDPYLFGFQMVASASTLEELVGIWDGVKEQRLVGPESQGSARREEFVAAWKARAHEIKAAAGPAPIAADESASSGVVEAEYVDDVRGQDQADADAAWQQVLTVAGEQGMVLAAVVDDFEQRYALNPSEASAAELLAYVEVLKGEGRAA